MDTKVEGPDTMLGSTVAGRYYVTRRIARGGMGVVYQAVQQGLGRTVALKIVRRESAGDPVMQKRFEREAKAAAALGHPSIVTVYEFGRTDEGELFLAMEFVDGESLRDALKRKRRMTFAETLPIVEAIASALARAHAAGVVHRDLKPENVMLPRQSATMTGAVAAKVLDFGLAKPHDPEMLAADEHLTREGGFVGTPGYAPPEQTEGAPENPRQDLYALGVLWHELLSGTHPFAAPTPMKMVVRQMNEAAPRVDSDATIVGTVPLAAADLIHSLLARDPDGRPESATLVLEHIISMRGARVSPSPSPPLWLGASSQRASPSPHASESSSSPTVDSLAPDVARADDRPDSRTVNEHARAIEARRSENIVAPPPKKRGGSSWLMLGAGVVVAGLAGAIVVATVTQHPTTTTDAGVADADAGAAVDSTRPVVPEGPTGVDIEIEGMPTFTALEALRELLPISTIASYSKGKSVLHVVKAEAPSIAEKLQGRALLTETPLVLEVKELSPGRVAVAVVRPEDASSLPDAGVNFTDGGSIDAAADAGAIPKAVPGGLAP